jgi:hypothetical protein
MRAADHPQFAIFYNHWAEPLGWLAVRLPDQS